MINKLQLKKRDWIGLFIVIVFPVLLLLVTNLTTINIVYFALLIIFLYWKLTERFLISLGVFFLMSITVLSLLSSTYNVPSITKFLFDQFIVFIYFFIILGAVFQTKDIAFEHKQKKKKFNKINADSKIEESSSKGTVIKKQTSKKL